MSYLKNSMEYQDFLTNSIFLRFLISDKMVKIIYQTVSPTNWIIFDGFIWCRLYILMIFSCLILRIKLRFHKAVLHNEILCLLSYFISFSVF